MDIRDREYAGSVAIQAQFKTHQNALVINYDIIQTKYRQRVSIERYRINTADKTTVDLRFEPPISHLRPLSFEVPFWSPE
jgi:hypothetical protein